VPPGAWSEHFYIKYSDSFFITAILIAALHASGFNILPPTIVFGVSETFLLPL